MPPIKQIDLSDGIRIVGSGVPSIWIKGKDFPKISPGEAEAEKEKEMEGILSRNLQANYEQKTLLSEYPSNDPVKQGQLLINERIEKIEGKDYLVSVMMYVAIHIYSTNPLKYTVKCQNSRVGPIVGEWWL